MNTAGRTDIACADDATGRETRAFPCAWFSTWRNVRDEGLSLPEFFARHPEAKLHKSVVLGLACEEYFRRNEQGETVDRQEFCQEFPAHQQSVARLLSVYDYLKQHDLLPARDATIADWPEPGETIAGYELLDGLGLGAFARVYLAAEPAVANRRVAVKVSVEGAAEAEILGKLSHANIVPIYSVREDDQQRWTLICMPYRGQATLDDVIGQLFCSTGARPHRGRELLAAIETINRFGEPVEPAPADPLFSRYSYVEAAMHLVAQLADALAYTHTKGICHRDLKPSNVLLGPDGRPMLLDFNLSQDRAVAERRLGGTLPYMAPEQLEATVLEPTATLAPIDPRSDLFSLGVIAYELLCGEWPYGPILPDLAPDEFATELYERQRSGPAPLVRRNPEVDRQLSDLIQRCLAFDPDARPQTALQLAAELRRSLSLRRRVARKVRRHSVAAAFVAGVLIVSAAATSYYFVTRDPYGVRELHAAREALAGDDFIAAVRRLDNASRFGVPAETRGALAEAYFDVGKKAYELKDYDAAQVHLTRAVDMGLNKWQARFYRGATCYRLERWEEAAREFAKAGPVSGGIVSACFAECCRKQYQHDRAKSNYLAAVDQGLQSAALLNNLGLATSNVRLVNGQHLIDAEHYFEAAIGLDPNLLLPRLNLALTRLQRCFSLQRDVSDEGTISAAREVAERAPDNPLIVMWVAECYAYGALPGDERYELAVKHLRRALEAGLPLKALRAMKDLRPVLKDLQDRPGFEELLRNPRKNPRKLVREFELLDELGF